MFPETIEITVIQYDVDLAYDFIEDTEAAACCPLHNSATRAGYIGNVGVSPVTGKYVLTLWQGHQYCCYVADEAGCRIAHDFDTMPHNRLVIEPTKVVFTKELKHV